MSRHAPETPFDAAVTPDEALRRLLEGNRRFLTGMAQHPNSGLEGRRRVANEQNPFAAVFGCVDSRVPPEMIFDQGLGDLIVIRTAAHVLDDVSLGTIEFSVAKLGVSLVMVLGHRRCGAVSTTLDVLDNNKEVGGKIDQLVKGIEPAVAMSRTKQGDLLDHSIRSHIGLTRDQLMQSSVISLAVNDGHTGIVGAYYDLDTGEVELTSPQNK